MKHYAFVISILAIAAGCARIPDMQMFDLDYDVVERPDSTLTVSVYHPRHASAQERMEALYYKGRNCRLAGNHQDAILAYKEAMKLAVKEGDLYWQAMTASELGYVFSAEFLSEEELKYMQEAYLLWSQYGDSTHVRTAMSDLAASYSNTGACNLADNLYEEICAQYPEDYDILVQRAHNALKMLPPDGEQAVRWFKTAIDGNVDMSLESFYEYAYALSLCGRKEESKDIRSELESYPRDLKANYLLYLIAENEGDADAALRHLKAYMDESDATVQHVMQQSLYKAVAEKAELEGSLESAMRKAAIILGILGMLLMLCILALMYLTFRGRKRTLEAENDKLVSMCDEAERMLALSRQKDDAERDAIHGLRQSFAKMYQSQFAAIGRMLDYNSSYTDSQIEAQRKEYAERICEIMKSISKDSKNQQKFEDIINAELDGIMAKLRKDFPAFKEADYQLLSYSIAGFDATTISILLDCTANNARVKKSRLIQKIQNSQSENTDLYLAFLSPKK